MRQTDSTDRLDALEPEEASRPMLRVIAVLPSAATLGNLLCGFLAIFCCLLSIRAAYFETGHKALPAHIAMLFPSYIAGGVYLVVAAMVCDALDGRLARMARRTSEFGAQLDSIADIVSFGAAPALLFITLLLRLAVPAEGEPLASKLLWRVGMAAALVYTSCAALRLARYNAENVSDESAQKRFSGLPTPAAAGAICSLILLHEDWFYNQFAEGAWVLRWVIAAAALGIGLMMVSRISYVHVVNVYVRRAYPPAYFAALLFVFAIGFYSFQVLLVTVAYAYVMFGLIQHLRQRRGAWRRALEPADN